MSQTPRWARATVTRVNSIHDLDLKRALAEEAENCIGAQKKKHWRRCLLAVHQICDRLIEAMTGRRDPLAEQDVPSDPTREYVRQEIEALPLLIANESENERVRALMHGREVTAQALKGLIGFLMAAGCPLCDYMIDGVGIDSDMGRLVVEILTGTGLIG